MKKHEGQGGASFGEVTPLSHSLAALLTLAVCAALAFTAFLALGTWQVQRLQWKTALIERVEQRIHAAPVPAPGPERWPYITAASDEYRHVRLTGTFLYELTTRVQAATALGGGYWLLTPLRSADGSVVLVNRGFIAARPAAQADARMSAPIAPATPEKADAGRGQSRAGQEQVVVTGLLRISEPGGAFLRHNDPAANRWYSRDVQAIAAARVLDQVAPYFVDADAAKAPDRVKAPDGVKSADGVAEPIGGLTVISFQNNHLVYALTWYALALMVAAASLWITRGEWRRRGRPGTSADSVARHTKKD